MGLVGKCVGVQGEVRGAVGRGMGGGVGKCVQCCDVGGGKERCVGRGVGECTGMGSVGKCVDLWVKDVGRGMGEV